MKLWLPLLFVVLAVVHCRAEISADCLEPKPRIMGRCRALQTGYFYDPSTESCLFITGPGCYVISDNFFHIKSRCEQDCIDAAAE